MQKTPTADADYAARAARAEHDREAVLKMIEQCIDTLCTAIRAQAGYGPYDDVDTASLTAPRFGISEAGDRCRVAEDHLVSLINGLSIDLTDLMKEAARTFDYEDLKPTRWHKRVGRELGDLRRRAELSVNEIAAVLIEDRDGAPKPPGWVRGVEAGRYAATSWDIREWCKICGASTADAWAMKCGRPATDEEREFYGAMDARAAEEVAS